jgi:hypothetical protein
MFNVELWCMKKLYFLIALVLLAMSKNALAGGGEKFGLGPLVIANFSKLNAAGWVSEYNSSLYGGAYTYINGKHWGLQAECLYGNTNVVTDNTFSGLYNQYLNNTIDSLKQGSFTFTQIVLPVMINYKFNKRFWVQGGVVYTANSNIIDNNNIIGSGAKIFNAGATSAVGGLMIKLPMRLSMHGRYILGFSDINKVPLSTTNWTTNSIQVGLGLRIL